MTEDKIEPSIYRYILKHTKKDQILLLLLTVLSMPFIYISLEVPKIIINSALGGVNIPESLFGYPLDQVRYLFLLCFAFLILVLINGGLKYLINLYRGILGERMLRRFRYDLYQRLLRFPLPHFKQVSQAEIIPIITAESEPLGGFIGDAYALPAFQGALLLTYLIFIFNQDWLLGLAAIALYPPQLYIIPKLQRKVNALAKSRVKAVRHFSDKIGETVSGIVDIHVNDTTHYERAGAASRLGKIYAIRFEIYRKKFFIKFLNNFLAQLTPFFFYAIGGYFVIVGKLSLGALVAVLAAYKDLASPWKELLKYYQITEDIKVKYKQIIDQFQPSNILKSSLQEDQKVDIDFASVPIHATAISYSEEHNIKSLDTVNFSINAGEHIGVLGLGGSGRSVLMQLISRILTPSSGRLRLADHDIAEISESVLGRHIGYVGQAAYIFTGTVKDNLLYALKNRQIKEINYSEAQKIAHNKYLKDAIASGNSVEDVTADWINSDALGCQNKDDFFAYQLNILKTVGLDQDIYQLGLYSSIISQDHPLLTQQLLEARERLQKLLDNDQYRHLVEKLDSQGYNKNLSVAENLLFGVPVQAQMNLEDLISHEAVQQTLLEAGLVDEFIAIGLQVAKIMVDIFIDVPEGNLLFERFSFINIDDLPVYARLSRMQKNDLGEISDKDKAMLLSLPFKLIVAKHRLGLITEPIQEKIIHAHTLLKNKLGINNDLIEFYNDKKVANFLSIQDNILFGRVAYGQVNAQNKVGKLIQDVIQELGLGEQIIQVGLDYFVGVAGARLNAVQRQKLAFARVLMKQPDILIVNEATAIFDNKSGNKLLKNILKAMPGKTIVWVLDEVENMDQFDHLLVLDKGKLIISDSPQEVRAEQDIMNKLT